MPHANAQWWTPADDATIRTAVAEGWSARKIREAHFPSRTQSAVDNRIQRLRGGGLAYLAPKAERHAASAVPQDLPVSAAEQIPEWLDRLRPVQLPPPPPPSATVSPGDFTLVASDFHFPQHCPASVSVFLEVVRQLRPRRVILNGDTVDLLAVSRYPKDQRHTWDLREEAKAFHEFLHQLVSLGRAWGLTILETEANHSGNGTASRWHRYLSDRVPVLYGHPQAERLLDYRTWWYPEWAPIDLVESVVIADDLLVIHGDLVRKHAAYSARGHAEKWQSSVMHGHTHRIGASVKRVPAMGTRPEALQRAYEIGCMCTLQPSYVSAPDWANGFAIVSHDVQERDYGVELVTIQRGQAVVAALGQTVRGA